MRAWLTPDSSLFSNPLDCRTLTIPGDLWLYVQGALEELAKDYNWEEFGDATPEETAQFFMEVMDNFSTSECGGGGMQFISSVQETIAVYTELTHPTGVINIVPGDLPEYIGVPSSLLLQFTITISDGGLFYVGGSAYRARQIRNVPGDGAVDRFTCHSPFDGVTRLRVLNPSPSYSIQVDLIGWQ